MSALDIWKGEFGNEYAQRNLITPEGMAARVALWNKLLSHIDTPRSICEVGSNIGQNLRALRTVTDAEFFAVEPNDEARRQLIVDEVVPAKNVSSGFVGMMGKVDLIFTSGVLIHVPPADLLPFYMNLHQHAARYVINIEYFANRPTMIPYRGEQDLLWKRDFGAVWLDFFHDMEPIACGFEWSRLTGLDDLTWWIMEKK